jgi:hypothetical protein
MASSPHNRAKENAQRREDLLCDHKQSHVKNVNNHSEEQNKQVKLATPESDRSSLVRIEESHDISKQHKHDVNHDREHNDGHPVHPSPRFRVQRKLHIHHLHQLKQNLRK